MPLSRNQENKCCCEGKFLMEAVLQFGLSVFVGLLIGVAGGKIFKLW